MVDNTISDKFEINTIKTGTAWRCTYTWFSMKLLLSFFCRQF